MTVGTPPNTASSLTRDRLPWLIGAAALAVYLVTLNHWVTLSNLTLVIRTSGWDWQPMLSQPLLYLVTLPFRLLPTGWVPLALNAVTAIAAALTLATLARTVALLPHNRVEAQRELVQDSNGLLSQPDAWVPMVLAALALGLQLTFWEHSIAASGEMLDLLLFAYVIRCLLEHRLTEKQSWLSRAAMVFGVAMANNWAMAAFLPFFVVAVLRTKRFSFFNLRTIQRIERDGWEKVKPALRTDLRFFVRMVLLWLAGASLFLLLPLVQALTPHSILSFWQALQASATGYETTLHLMGRLFLRFHRDLALLLAAATLLPILLLSIRWGSLGGRSTPGQIDVASYILHVAHAFLLLLCLLAMYDPPFSPRQVAQQNGLPLIFLPLYYLTAISIGYYCGFFLLLFGAAALQRTSRRYPTRRILCRAVPILVYVVAVLAVTGLLPVNLRAIRAGRAPHLERYAKLAAQSLPAEGALVFSDDPARLALLLAEMAREGKAKLYLPVDTHSLPIKAYRAWLSRKYPGRWPDPATETASPLAAVAGAPTDAPLDAQGIVNLVARVAEGKRVYWLQPAVGLLFDYFYLLPHGLVHEMKTYPTFGISPPLLTPAELHENLAFWKSTIETAVKPVEELASLTELPRPAFEQSLMKRGHLRTPPPPQVRVLAWWYSGALNRWGVNLQRNGQWSEAAPCFALAKELKPDNLPASVNFQCNSNLLARQEMTVSRGTALDEQFGRYKNLNQVLTENGPLDDPSYCFNLGLSFARGGMIRQGLQQLERVREMVPRDLITRIALGDLYNTAGMPDQALRIVAEIRDDPKLRPLGQTNEVELDLLEARAWYTKTNSAKADGIIYALLGFHPNDTALRERAVATFMAYKSYAQALRVTDRQLEQSPEDLTALTQKGNLYLLTGDFSNAIPVLTHLLSLTNAYGPRLSRSYAYKRSGQLDAAEADCRELLQTFPDVPRTYREMADIAQQRKDTNAAIRYFEQFLAKAEGDNDENRAVAARLRELRQSRQ